MLALAVGAKLYPIVLTPLFFCSGAKSFGWKYAVAPTVLFVATTLFVLWPMLPSKTTDSRVATNVGASASELPTFNGDNDPSLGVMTFLRQWEMNDFIFLLLVENLRPTSNSTPDRVAWFSVLPESLRQRLTATVAFCFGIPREEIAFLVSRAITAIAFLVLTGWFAWRAAKAATAESFCEAGFLTLAWFWLLCPTQNPWYWTWTIPLLPFARSRSWLVVSGIVLLYYLRFWLSYHWPETPILGTPYVGSVFFDFVVTWLEFAPWLGWLAIDGYRTHYLSYGRRCRHRRLGQAA